MITAPEAVNTVYHHLKASALMNGPQKPSGGLFKYQRPFNSAKEDFVINSLAMNRAALQEGVLNVNIHVPNLGTGNTAQPDTARLTQLTQLASETLDEVWHEKADYVFSVQQDNILQDTDLSWYSNIRVEFKYVNL